MEIDRKRVSEIKTRDEFIEFMNEFVKLIKDGEQIENKTTDAYIGAMVAWIEDMEGYYEIWVYLIKLISIQ